jgi:hypothetical protein
MKDTQVFDDPPLAAESTINTQSATVYKRVRFTWPINRLGVDLTAIRREAANPSSS